MIEGIESSDWEQQGVAGRGKEHLEIEVLSLASIFLYKSADVQEG